MRTAVITIASGRHHHLAAQQRGIAASVRQPDGYIVVAMGDGQIRGVVRNSDFVPTVVDVPVPDGRLPLAFARNAGAAAALRTGAELLVFLDVDCVPSKALLTRYEFAAQLPQCGCGLLSGPVAYLPESATGTDPETWPALARPHPARPVPLDGDVVLGTDPNLFWSLSFAVTAKTWRHIGGFCEDYRGYGGEDTDYSRLAAKAGVTHWWVGGATAFHQHHVSQSPPIDHLDDILRNAQLFHQRWGEWPMLGWLEEFKALGLVEIEATNGRWQKL
jgi:GT2 family glycosyltransferase